MLFTPLFTTLAIALSVAAAPVDDALALAPRAVTSGVNNWDCKAEPGKDPIIFVHGLNSLSGINWITKAPIFAAKGYCTYTPQYGTVNGIVFGGGDVRASSREIAAFVDAVRGATGAKKVNLVGHSLGTVVSTYYMKFDGGASKVSNFVGLGGVVKGTTLGGLTKLLKAIPGLENSVMNICTSCVQITLPSDFIGQLSAGGIAVAGPKYTMIASSKEVVVVPYTNGLIYESGVKNIVLQKECGLDLAGHLMQAIDPNVTSFILWALNGRKGDLPGCVPWLVPGKRDGEVVVDPHAPSFYFPHEGVE